MTQRIGLEEVKRIATLARLTLDEAELNRMQSQLDSILDSMDSLNRLDVSGVEPTYHAIAMSCQLRADQPRPSLKRSEALEAAARSESGGFAVPKVMEGE